MKHLAWLLLACSLIVSGCDNSDDEPDEPEAGMTGAGEDAGEDAGKDASGASRRCGRGSIDPPQRRQH